MCYTLMCHPASCFGQQPDLPGKSEFWLNRDLDNVVSSSPSPSSCRLGFGLARKYSASNGSKDRPEIK
jgi:hypothetical protein